MEQFSVRHTVSHRVAICLKLMAVHSYMYYFLTIVNTFYLFLLQVIKNILDIHMKSC